MAFTIEWNTVYMCIMMKEEIFSWQLFFSIGGGIVCRRFVNLRAANFAPPSRQPAVKHRGATKGSPQPIRRALFGSKGKQGHEAPKGRILHRQELEETDQESGVEVKILSFARRARRHLPRTCRLTFACVLPGMAQRTRSRKAAVSLQGRRQRRVSHA